MQCCIANVEQDKANLNLFCFEPAIVDCVEVKNSYKSQSTATTGGIKGSIA